MGFVPQRLHDARIMYGYTVEQLADKLGITKQAVSKYETGQTIPSAEILHRIMDVFSLPVGYLTKEEVVPQNRTPVFYRKTKRTPMKELEMAQISIKWCYELVAACHAEPKKTDLLLFRDDLPTEAKAWQQRTAWGLGEEPVDNMGLLLENHGLSVFQLDLPNDKIDGFSQVIDGHPMIVLNAKRGNDARKNFSLAHELGHIVLHIHKQDVDEERMEEEADLFAGCFLIPGDALQRELVRVDAESLIRFAGRWNVSPEAVLMRCEQVGMLEEAPEVRCAQKTYLFKQLRKKMSVSVSADEYCCSLQPILERINNDRDKTRQFLKEVCFPVELIRRFCRMPDLFKDNSDLSNPMNINDIDGVQLSLDFC